MAFGQQVGPPATAKQVSELLTLLREAGHSDFRDARGPMGFTQRQAAGRFSRDEATGFIEQLQDADDPAPVEGPPIVAPRVRTPEDRMLRSIPAEALATELRRRGWRVVAP